MPHLILASQSTARQAMLAQAGIICSAKKADIDERAIEDLLGDEFTPADRALVLAEAKAQSVSDTLDKGSDDLILGCDQILEDHEGKVLHKAKTMKEARFRLLHLSGRRHHLHSALAIVQNGQTIWRHTSTASLTMRILSPEYIGRHLSGVGNAILGSVGCYHYEGKGINLFEKVEGDYHTILGMPLLPLLAELRRHQILDA